MVLALLQIVSNQVKRCGSPYIVVAISQDFVQHMAELPAQDGAGAQREALRVGPECVGSLLPVSPQDDSYSRC